MTTVKVDGIEYTLIMRGLGINGGTLLIHTERYFNDAQLNLIGSKLAKGRYEYKIVECGYIVAEGHCNEQGVILK